MPVTKGSWYGGPNDHADNNRPASGIPNTVPGIARPTRATLKGYYRVVFPNGRSLVLQHTDMGPAAWAGRKIDINYTAVKRAGYTESNFPTDAPIEYHYLGKTKPAWADKGSTGKVTPKAKKKVKAAAVSSTSTADSTGRRSLLLSYLADDKNPDALTNLALGLRALG